MLKPQYNSACTMGKRRAKFEWEPKTALEWMILGQHHRLPTRLLDWSESLLVAAYFAVENPTSEAAIYGVEAPLEWEDIAADPFRDDIGEQIWLIRPPHISPRITAQIRCPHAPPKAVGRLER